jgi:hypothetical protein
LVNNLPPPFLQVRILNELRACLLEVPILKEVSGLPRIDGVSGTG